MSISQINASNATAILGLQSPSNYAVEKTDYSNEISDEYTESDDTSKFKSIVKKYDITNISCDEIEEMYKELYGNGLINSEELLKATAPVQVMRKKIESGVTDSNEKFDFLEILKTQTKLSEKYGDPKSKESNKHTLKLAEKIHYFQS